MSLWPQWRTRFGRWPLGYRLAISGAVLGLLALWTMPMLKMNLGDALEPLSMALGMGNMGRWMDIEYALTLPEMMSLLSMFRKMMAIFNKLGGDLLIEDFRDSYYQMVLSLWVLRIWFWGTIFGYGLIMYYLYVHEREDRANHALTWRDIFPSLIVGASALFGVFVLAVVAWQSVLGVGIGTLAFLVSALLILAGGVVNMAQVYRWSWPQPGPPGYGPHRPPHRHRRSSYGEPFAAPKYERRGPAYASRAGGYPPPEAPPPPSVAPSSPSIRGWAKTSADDEPPMPPPPPPPAPPPSPEAPETAPFYETVPAPPKEDDEQVDATQIYDEAEDIGLSAWLEDMEGQRHRVVAPQTLIGRHPNNNLRLSHPSVSKHHARIFYQQGQFWLEDLNSTNGTRVNGQKVRGRFVPLSSGDTIYFGVYGPFRFQVE